MIENNLFIHNSHLFVCPVRRDLWINMLTSLGIRSRPQRLQIEWCVCPSQCFSVCCWWGWLCGGGERSSGRPHLSRSRASPSKSPRTRSSPKGHMQVKVRDVCTQTQKELKESKHTHRHLSSDRRYHSISF